VAASLRLADVLDFHGKPEVCRHNQANCAAKLNKGEVPMNISHISVSTLPVLHRFGGAIERRIVEIAQEQARRGHRVSVYSVGDETQTQERAGVSYHFLKCRSRLPWKHFEFQYQVVKGLKRKSSEDVLHFHSQPEGALLSKWVAGKKVLSYDYFAFRGGRATPLYHVYKHVLRRFDLLLPCSSYCLQESQNFWRLPDSKLRVLYNGVNTQQFQPDPAAAARERKNLGINKRVVLYVGRVCEQKGSDILLRAIEILNQRRTDIQLVIAGPIGQFGLKDDSQRWINRIHDVGGLYLGAVEESRLAAVYNLADVFVMPTRVMEMFGMAAAEAQACGKPVVASDCGGLREVVPTDCGARFPVGDANKLAEEIEKLLDDPARYAACAANAVRNAARYDWAAICDTLETLYR
jgi:glycosyltransferase involved in cell wall biosynthesis